MKNYQSTELQNISWSFVEMVGDSRPCDDFVQLDAKVDRAFKNWCLRSRRRYVVMTYSIALATYYTRRYHTELTHVRQMMHNAIHVTLSTFSTSITP